MIFHPYCFWCNTELQECEAYYTSPQKSMFYYPKNTAVIDHIQPRTVREKRELNNSPKVLSCIRCDKRRSKWLLKRGSVKQLIIDGRNILYITDTKKVYEKVEGLTPSVTNKEI